MSKNIHIIHKRKYCLHIYLPFFIRRNLTVVDNGNTSLSQNKQICEKTHFLFISKHKFISKLKFIGKHRFIDEHKFIGEHKVISPSPGI